MDWSETNMVSESFNIDHTIVVQTPCIHVGLSEVLGMLLLLLYQHVHFYCVWDFISHMMSSNLPSIFNRIHLLSGMSSLRYAAGTSIFPHLFLRVHQ